MLFTFCCEKIRNIAHRFDFFGEGSLACVGAALVEGEDLRERRSILTVKNQTGATTAFNLSHLNLENFFNGWELSVAAVNKLLLTPALLLMPRNFNCAL